MNDDYEHVPGLGTPDHPDYAARLSAVDRIDRRELRAEDLRKAQRPVLEPPRAQSMDLAGEPGRCEFCGNSLPAGVDEGVCTDCVKYGEPCRNGNRGQMKHGDERDCRCADCSSDRVDAVMDASEDR